MIRIQTDVCIQMHTFTNDYSRFLLLITLAVPHFTLSNFQIPAHEIGEPVAMDEIAGFSRL